MTEVDVMTTGVHVGTAVVPPIATVVLPGRQLDVVTKKVVVVRGRVEVSNDVVVSVVRKVLVEVPAVRMS